jgi:hypothetical protein
MPIEFGPPPAQVQPFNIPAVQYTDPLETLARMQQMRTQNIQAQGAQLGLQQAQMQMDSNRARLNAFVQAGNDPDKAYQLMIQSGRVLPNDLFGFQQHMTTLQTQKATLRKDQQEILGKDWDRASAVYGNVTSQDELNAANATLDGEGNQTQRITSYPGDTDHMQALANGIGMQSQIMTRKKTAAEIQKETAQTQEAQAGTTKTGIETTGLLKNQLAADVKTLPKDPQTGTPTPDSWVTVLKNPAYKDLNLPEVPTKDYIDKVVEYPIPEKDIPEYRIKARQADAMASMKPADWDTYVDSVIPPGGDTAALNARTKAQVRGAIASGAPMTQVQAVVKDASDQIGRTETGVRTAKATLPIKVEVATQTAVGRADAAGLTDDDYQRAGEQYARTGVMPAMGRDSITRGRIAHYANQWARDNGLKPAELVAMQAAYAGDKDSLKKFQSQRDQIVSFEQTAQKNLDLFLNLASKIPDTGIPWINRPIRELDQSVVGSENMAAVNAARQVANNEIAKVTSGGGLGGVLSDSARNEVASYNPNNATFAQTKAVANILKQDMANRHQSMDATLSDIKSRIGGGTTVTPAAGGPPTVTTKQQFDALPSKTIYIGKDGRQYQKP